MKRFGTVLAAAALLAMGIPSGAQAQAVAAELVTFGVITDTHVRTGAPGTLPATVAALNAAGVDLVLQLGDYAQDGVTAQYATAEPVMSGLEMPYFLIPGNHDNTSAMIAGTVLDEPGYYSFDFNGVHFVGLDDSSYSLPAVQLAWFAADLAASSLPTVVFMHVPALLTNSAPGMSYPYGTRINNHAEVLNVIASDSDVIMVLNGHIHPDAGVTQYRLYRGVWYITNAAVSNSGDNYRVFTVYDDGSFVADGFGANSDFAAGGWLEGWTYRRAISFDMAAAPGDVFNFPVRIQLDSRNFDFTLARPDGADVRVCNEASEALAFEIAFWDPVGRSAEIWARVPVLRGGSSYENFVYLYSGNAVVGDARDAANTWFEAVAVWHLNEAGGATALDSSGNGNDGALVNSPARSPGYLTFNGSNQYVSTPLSMDGNGSVVVRAKGGDWTAEAYLVGELTAGTPRDSFGIRWYSANDIRAGWTVGGSENDVSTGSALSEDWTTLQLDWNTAAPVTQAFVSGESAGQLAAPVAVYSSPSPVNIGARGGTNTKFFNGSIGDVQVWKTARGPDWARLAAMNWDSSWLRFGVGESNGVLIVPITYLSRYIGRRITVSGWWLGHAPGYGAPPVTRSDWLLGDGTGAVYVTGIAPVRPGTLQGVVASKGGQVYLKVYRQRRR